MSETASSSPASETIEETPIAAAYGVRRVNGFLAIGDQHLTSSAPERRRRGYAGAILRKIDAAIQIANEYGYMPLFEGDLFHQPVEEEERIKAILFDILRRSWITPIGNTGNHDKRGQRLAKSDSLAVVGSSGLLDVVSRRTGAGEAFLFEVDGKIVSVGLSPYGTDIPDDLSFLNDGADKRIWMTHHDIGFAGAYPGAIEPFPIAGCDVVLNGHMHLYRDPVFHGDTAWCNFGAIARTAVDAYDEVPCVYGVLNDPEGGFSFERHQLPHMAPAEAFDMTGRHARAIQVRHDTGADQAIPDGPMTDTEEALLAAEQPGEFATALREEVDARTEQSQSGHIMRETIENYLTGWRIAKPVAQEILSVFDETVDSPTP